MTKVFVLLAAIIGALAVAPAHAATAIPDGRWSFVYRDAKLPDRPVRVYTYRPKACDAACPMVLVLHGMKRDASRYLAHWQTPAEVHRLVIVAPEFSQQHWPKAAGYSQAAMPGQEDGDKWGFAVLERLFDEVGEGRAGYALFGHSAGGQFVHRMALFAPRTRATALVAANPGWYAMPEWREGKAAHPFPYSMRGSPAGEAQARTALGRRFVLMLGEKDVDADDDSLNRSEGARHQGDNRVERGENFFKAATTLAGELAVPLRWELVEVPGVAHDGAAMSERAARLLFSRP